MKNLKKLGIWMDHTIAHIIVLDNNTVESNTIESLQDEKQNFGNDESLEQNTEQAQLAEFFKRLSAVIMKYSEILLFGPTNAKTELYNLLKDDGQFKNIKIEVKTTDKLTDNRMDAFVKGHFEKVA
jgi:stalled ribosome rescue protein Dom34